MSQCAFPIHLGTYATVYCVRQRHDDKAHRYEFVMTERDIRAISAPAAPKAPERGACDDCDGTGWLSFSDGTRVKCAACREPNREAGGDKP